MVAECPHQWLRVFVSRAPVLCLLSQPHLDTTPHTVKSFWYISTCCTPAWASFPLHKCDRRRPCEAPVVFPARVRNSCATTTWQTQARRPLPNRSKGYSHLQPNKMTTKQQMMKQKLWSSTQESLSLISIDCVIALLCPGSLCPTGSCCKGNYNKNSVKGASCKQTKTELLMQEIVVCRS